MEMHIYFFVSISHFDTARVQVRVRALPLILIFVSPFLLNTE